MASSPVRRRIRVEGIVQGVGFRPYVFGLAVSLQLSGVVGNDAHGVFVEVEGPAAQVDEFVARLPADAPPLAVVEHLDVSEVEPTGASRFEIVASEGDGQRDVLVSPDVATCGDCLTELWDPGDRRHRYPFINCTNCGPRFTIIRDVPYDRPTTTMAGFAMCADCRAEYDDPTDRRFHAQPVCCPACGPALHLLVDGVEVDGDPLTAAARLLDEGRVVAIKGLGGYHLAAAADDEEATQTLRARKHREDKPFAVMVADLDVARSLCHVGEAEARLLAGIERPIVLLERRLDAAVAAAVAPGNRSLGLMLPYTPLHHLLAEQRGRPFVLTSGNMSDEPIAYIDDEALERLGGIADAFLVHDRPIHMRTDDSVVRVLASRPMSLRRSRGFVPRPVTLPWPFPRPVLAVGAELKNTFCVARQRHAFVSHHIGDLENWETLRSFREGIDHFCRLFDVTPDVVVHDLHPEYLSTKHALELDDVEHIGVQHHHAHIASCLADNHRDEPVIGIAFDGTGYGTDGTIWGGEILVADLAGFERVGHLQAVPLPGGAAAIREPWRMAASWLAATDAVVPDDLAIRTRNADRWDDVLAVARSGVNSPMTSSVGRLFDAVAALLDIRDAINFEGQAAVELEQAADPSTPGALQAALIGEQPFEIVGADLVTGVLEELVSGEDPRAIAMRFHRGIAQAIAQASRRVREATGHTTVALSGGVFQNVLLTTATIATLEDDGFEVLTHRLVPPNDGGISLGQAAVVGARDRMPS